MSSSNFLAKMQEYLTDKKTSLVREIATQLENERNTNRDDCLDTCELASEENEREISTMLSERGQLKIGQIEDALRRIESLKYGLCEMCGLKIGEARLDAMPFARLCCDCQEDRERSAKIQRPWVGLNYDRYTNSVRPERIKRALSSH
jgi:DnaK suppressor protein